MEASTLAPPRSLTVRPSRRLLAAFSDERLVDQVRRGNSAAFEAIYDRHHGPILSFCRHMLGSREEAEDAVQHTFVQAFESMRSSEREILLRPWLYTIARNRCLSILRSRREQPAELDDVPTAGLTEAVQHRGELRDLLHDLRDLPDDQRAALVLAELGDLSHAEIAAIVGCDRMKVKSLVFQARSSLIESRDARAIPCQEIREQVANLRGGALRRSALRRHLKGCPGCSEYRAAVRRQRQMLAALLPVVPTASLRGGTLAASVGTGAGGGGGGGAIASGAAASGGLSGALGSAGAAKLAAVIVAASAALGTGLVIDHHVARHSTATSHPTAPALSRKAGPTASSAVRSRRSASAPGVTLHRDLVLVSGGGAAVARGLSLGVRGHGRHGGRRSSAPPALFSAPPASGFTYRPRGGRADRRGGEPNGRRALGSPSGGGSAPPGQGQPRGQLPQGPPLPRSVRLP